MPLLDVFWACFREVKVSDCTDPARSAAQRGWRQLGTTESQWEGSWASETSLELERIYSNLASVTLTSSVNICCFPMKVSRLADYHKTCLHCFPGLATKAIFLTPLSLSFLSFKMKPVVVPTSIRWWGWYYCLYMKCLQIKEIMRVKFLAWCLAYSIHTSNSNYYYDYYYSFPSTYIKLCVRRHRSSMKTKRDMASVLKDEVRKVIDLYQAPVVLDTVLDSWSVNICWMPTVSWAWGINERNRTNRDL